MTTNGGNSTSTANRLPISNKMDGADDQVLGHIHQNHDEEDQNQAAAGGLAADMANMRDMIMTLYLENQARRQEHDRLIGAINPAALPQNEQVAAVRTKNFATLKLNFRKSYKVKDFKTNSESKVEDWIVKFEDEMDTLKSMSGIDGELTDIEKRGLLKDRLDYPVKQRITTALSVHNPVYTWDNVPYDTLKKVLKQEFGVRESKVSSILYQFNAKQLKRQEDECVSVWYHRWMKQMPDVFKPNTDAEKDFFIDLIMRALFYVNVNDQKYQEHLCKLPDETATLKLFLDESLLAESRRKIYNDIDESKEKDVALSRFEYKKGKFNKFKPKKSVTDESADSAAGQEKSTGAVGKPDESKVDKSEDGKPKRYNKYAKFKCYTCNKMGHIAKNCFKGKKTSNVKQTDIQEENEEGTYEFNKVNIQVDKPKEIKLAKAGLNNNKQLMASVELQHKGKKVPMSLECDTAASHSVLSLDNFKRFAKISTNDGQLGKVIGKKETVSIRLADGSYSDKCMGSIVVPTKLVSKDDYVSIKYFIIDGPNSLLGRQALRSLFPSQYNQLEKAVEISVTEVLVEEDKDESESMPAAAASAESGESGLPKPELQIPLDNSKKQLQFPEGKMTKQQGEHWCKQICDLYPTIFNSEKGEFKGVTANITVKEGMLDKVQQIGVRPPAKIPYGLEKQYNEKLDELMEDCIPCEGQDIFVASQLVPVCKIVDGVKTLRRLAINYKPTINPFLEEVPHVTTSCDEQIERLAGGEFFTVVDLRGAFKQIKVNPGLSQKILAIVTPRGYAIPKRLQYGVKVAPGIWNQAMNKLINSRGTTGKPIPAAVVVDDVCITGKSAKEHLENLHEFFYRLHEAGLKVNIDKCKFFQTEVKFLGKIISKKGIMLDPATTDAILQMPRPTNKGELRSFLGHISYISRHIPGVREVRNKLDQLLKADAQFVWEKEHDKAFIACKELAASPAMLAHFDASKPLVLTTDASSSGVGACLAHKEVREGKVLLNPIAYASASLKASEKNYSQVDREGLAIVWAILHFKQFLWLQKFELHTDCSALVRIFGDKFNVNGIASSRLIRWSILLSEFDFTILHIRGKYNHTADSLSRLPKTSGAKCPQGEVASVSDLVNNYEDYEVLNTVACLAIKPKTVKVDMSISQFITSDMEAWDIIPVSIKDVKTATSKSAELGKLYRYITAGTIDRKDEMVKRFVGVFNELYVEDGLIYYGHRVVIPVALRKPLLEELHYSHIGSEKMRAVAAKSFWWPGLPSEIDNTVKECPDCKKYMRKPSKNPICSWPMARRPLERVHIDYMSYKGKFILVMVDAYSKYAWAKYMDQDTTTVNTLRVLYGWFTSEHGFPLTVVSDNGPQFTATEFGAKLKRWGCVHLTTPPYHPSSNGICEKMVGTIKSHLKRMKVAANKLSISTSLSYICRVLGLTPNAATARCPFEVIKSSPMPNMFPKLSAMEQQLSREADTTDKALGKGRYFRSFKVNDHVLLYDVVTKTSIEGTVTQVRGRNDYTVQCVDKVRHVSGDVLRHSYTSATTGSSSSPAGRQAAAPVTKTQVDTDDTASTADSEWSCESESDIEMEDSGSNATRVLSRYVNPNVVTPSVVGEEEQSVNNEVIPVEVGEELQEQDLRLPVEQPPPPMRGRGSISRGRGRVRRTQRELIPTVEPRAQLRSGRTRV